MENNKLKKYSRCNEISSSNALCDSLKIEGRSKWSNCLVVPPFFKFKGKPGFLRKKAVSANNPVSYFRQIFTPDLSSELIEQINNNPQNTANKFWLRTNDKEIDEFLSILMQMRMSQVINEVINTDILTEL